MKYDLLKLFMVISKHTIYVLVLIWLGRPVIFAGEAAGQSIHDIMISIDLSDSPILEALNSIEEKTNFTFAYGRDVRELEAHINLAKDQISVGAALMHISMVTGIEFRQINNTISAKVQRGMDNNQFSKYRLQGEDQTAVIQGRVTDENGNPLPGATILEKGSTNGTVSDVDGNFQLEVPETAILTISFIGYIKYEIALNGETYLNIKLNLDSEALEEVVVVGYGTQTKKDITTSVGIISASDLQNQAISNIDQGMVGRLAGVQVTQSTGEPGVPTSIRIRGTKSITAGNGPLYVVDGVPLDQSFQVMQSIDPNDIESLTVLKDASAAAIYGSRGSNGVVVITTKRGKEGKMKVSYNSWIGVQQVSKKVKLLDAYQYAQLAKDGHDNAYIDEITGATIADPDNVRPAGYHKTPEDLLPYLNNESGLTNTDWQDEIFRRARITNHNVSLSGGKGGVNYFISGYYTKQDGIIIQSDFEKYGMKVNLETVADRLSAGVSFTPSYSVSNKVDAYGPYFDAGVVGTALQAAPVWSVYNPDGTYNFEMNGKWRIGTDYQHNEILNPVAIAHLVDDQVTRSNILSNAWVGYEIIEGLKAKLSVASNVNFNTEDYYRPSTLPDRGFNNYLNPSNPIARASSNDYKNLLLEGTLNFTRNFGDHAINLLSGYTIQKETRSFRSVTATNFPNDLVKTVNAGEVIDGTSTISEWGLVSFLSRAQYGYQSKYLVSAAIRADGSSRFAPNNKWGFFPSLSMGWRISQEEFLQGLSQINELKLRGSYGLTGNFQIGNYEYLSSLSSASYVVGSGDGTLGSGFATSSLENSDLSWEKTAMLDIGLDASFFDGLLGFTVDWYDSRTTDLLLQVPVPLHTGFSTALQNVGEVQNKGWEFALTSDRKIGGFSYSFGANIAFSKNKVLALGPENAPIIATAGVNHNFYITQVGKPIGSNYILIEDGIFENQAEIDSYPHFENAQPGDFKFVDINKDGEIDVNEDRYVAGSYFPDYTFGANGNFVFMGFDFGFNLQGVQGNEILNLMNRYINSMEGNFNNTTDALNRWRSESEPGDGSTNRANRKAKGNNGRTSTWHLEDGSYIRLQNVSVGYTLPKPLTDKMHLSLLRIYLTAQNLATWTNYKGYNPEVNLYDGNALTPGTDYGSYPLAKSASLGINLKF